MRAKSSSHRLSRARKKQGRSSKGSEAAMKDFSFQEHKLVGSQPGWPEVTQMTNKLCRWHSNQQNQMRSPSEGSQPQTLSGEQSNLQQSWNQVSRSSWEELNLSRLLEVFAGMNFRERNTNEELLICQEERPEKMVPMAGESQQQKREISSMLTSSCCLAVWIIVCGG